MQNKQKHLAIWTQYTFKQRVKTAELPLLLKYVCSVFYIVDVLKGLEMVTCILHVSELGC